MQEEFQASGATQLEGWISAKLTASISLGFTSPKMDQRTGVAICK